MLLTIRRFEQRLFQRLLHYVIIFLITERWHCGYYIEVPSSTDYPAFTALIIISPILTAPQCSSNQIFTPTPTQKIRNLPLGVFKMCQVSSFLYHVKCGYTILVSIVEKCRNECGCMDQPDYYRLVNAKCPDCIYGSPQLPQSNRNQALADFKLLQAEGDKFRAELNQRMSLKKHIFAVFSPERLTYDKAQRRQALRGNLEKVLKYSLDRMAIWTHGRNDLMMPFLRYQRTLITFLKR